MSSWTCQYDDFVVLVWYNDIVVVIIVLLTNQLHVYNESLHARREVEHSNTVLSPVSINSCTIVCLTCVRRVAAAKLSLYFHTDSVAVNVNHGQHSAQLPAQWKLVCRCTPQSSDANGGTKFALCGKV